VKAVKPICGCDGEVPLDWCEIKKKDRMGYVRCRFINPGAAGDLWLYAG